MLKDIKPGVSGSSPSNLKTFQGLVYFRVTDGVNGYELWVSNGTTEGTNMLRDINADGSSQPGYFMK